MSKVFDEIRQEGREQGREQACLESLRAIMETLHLTVNEAMDVLNIPAEDRPRLLEKL